MRMEPLGKKITFPSFCSGVKSACHGEGRKAAPSLSLVIAPLGVGDGCCGLWGDEAHLPRAK